MYSNRWKIRNDDKIKKEMANSWRADDSVDGTIEEKAVMLKLSRRFSLL